MVLFCVAIVTPPGMSWSQIPESSFALPARVDFAIGPLVCFSKTQRFMLGGAWDCPILVKNHDMGREHDSAHQTRVSYL
jgi:hypothetical protein